MASSSASSPLPFIKALYLNEATSAAVHAVSQAVKHDQEESGQSVLLAAKTLGEAKNWSPVLISQESWAKVSALGSQLMSESDSLIPVVTAVNPAALYLYEKAMVVQMHKGFAPVKSWLTMEEDCGLVVPLGVSDEMTVTAWDETRGEDVYRLILSTGKAFVMSGTTKVSIAGTEPLVCVVFCLAAGSGEGR